MNDCGCKFNDGFSYEQFIDIYINSFEIRKLTPFYVYCVLSGRIGKN